MPAFLQCRSARDETSHVHESLFRYRRIASIDHIETKITIVFLLYICKDTGKVENSLLNFYLATNDFHVLLQ